MRDRLASGLSVAIAIVCLVLFFFIFRQVESVATRLDNIDRNSRAVVATEQFIRSDEVYNTDRVFCSDAATAVCKLTAPQLYDNLGRHPPLWVLFDALLELGKINLPADHRGQFNRILADIYSSSNKFGAIEVSMKESPSEWADSNTMYRGVLARAILCKNELDVCQNGLSADTRAALVRLIQFVKQNGPTLAPYETNMRIAAVNLAAEVLSSSRNP